jgi:hypothetical protein
MLADPRAKISVRFDGGGSRLLAICSPFPAIRMAAGERLSGIAAMAILMLALQYLVGS